MDLEYILSNALFKGLFTPCVSLVLFPACSWVLLWTIYLSTSSNAFPTGRNTYFSPFFQSSPQIIALNTVSFSFIIFGFWIFRFCTIASNQMTERRCVRVCVLMCGGVMWWNSGIPAGENQCLSWSFLSVKWTEKGCYVAWNHVEWPWKNSEANHEHSLWACRFILAQRCCEITNYTAKQTEVL